MRRVLGTGSDFLMDREGLEIGSIQGRTNHEVYTCFEIFFRQNSVIEYDCIRIGGPHKGKIFFLDS